MQKSGFLYCSYIYNSHYWGICVSSREIRVNLQVTCQKTTALPLQLWGHSSISFCFNVYAFSFNMSNGGSRRTSWYLSSSKGSRKLGTYPPFRPLSRMLFVCWSLIKIIGFDCRSKSHCSNSGTGWRVRQGLGGAGKNDSRQQMGRRGSPGRRGSGKLS